MMTELRQIRLGDHAKVISGFAFKSSVFTEEGVPVIKIGNIKVSAVELEGCEYVPDEIAKAINSKFHVTQGDILISLTGSHMTQPNSVVGRVGQYKQCQPALLNQRAGKVTICDPEILQNDYLYSLLSTKAARAEIALLAHGAANQANVAPKDIERVKFNILPFAEQEKTAAILTAYDDLIEINKRRIAVLEKIAEELYREWFVRMRFPGHQNTKFVKGAPVDWSYERLENLCSLIKRGVSPSYSDQSEFLVINQKCIRDSRINLTEARAHNTRVPDEKYLQYGDALINSTGVGTLGRVSIVESEPNMLTVDSHVTICRANDNAIDKHYLAHTVCQLKPYFEFMAAGSTGQVELNRSLIAGIKIFVPFDYLQNMFAEQVSSIWKQKQQIAGSNSILINTRDLLLPRLISGKLSLEDVDIQFPPRMREEAIETPALEESAHA